MSTTHTTLSNVFTLPNYKCFDGEVVGEVLQSGGRNGGGDAIKHGV